MSIGQGDKGLLALDAGTQVEEPREQAKTSRRLAAPDLAVAVGDGKPAVAADTPRPDLDLLDALTQKRFDGVAPQLENSRAHERTLEESASRSDRGRG